MLDTAWWMWLLFFAMVGILIAVDLFLFGGGKSHRVSRKEALGWTITWFLFAILFNLLYWFYLKATHPMMIADQKATEFFTGYLIEKSLSMDNIFVIAMIFNYFAIPKEYQRRVLIYGVLGAIIMRMLLIFFGIVLIKQFIWILYIFGAFLLFTGVKMLIFAEHKPDLKTNPVLLWMKNHLSITHELHKEKFTIRQNKKTYFTPLFVVLVLIEITDLIFAVDSIPAIFAITHDPFIVFTSNIFAILGLRALYFLLADMDEKFHLLKYGLAIILIFIGAKMLIHYWIVIPVFVSLSVVGLILFISIVASVRFPKKV